MPITGCSEGERMNHKSRSYNSAVNAVVNIVAQFIVLLVNFGTRKIFIVAFGENYLGISGLYSNILSVLSLAELGVGSAILYCLYKPVAENDYDHITALINYYKKLYRIIGLFVAAMGLLVVPFLNYLVNIEADVGNITLYYLLYLANVVASYFLVYKTAILIADQKNYVIKICTAIVQVVQFAVLSVIALVFRNYTLYLILQILFSILTNIVCSVVASEKYPFINGKSRIEAEEKKSIWANIKAMFSYQVGNVIVNHTDNILISLLISTITVGFYSNYSMVVSSVNTFAMLIFTSVQASIGNLAAKETAQRQYDVFRKLSVVGFCLTSFATVSFLTLFQDFITILYTDHYLLDFKVVIACSLNFYMVNILQPVYCYRNTVGLFKHTKRIMIYTAIVNIVLSVILGKIWGLFGILFATFLSRLVTNFWYEPIKLYRNYFHRSPGEYFAGQLWNAVITALMAAVLFAISIPLGHINIYVRFLIKTVLCVAIPFVTYLIRFRKNEVFMMALDVCRRVIKRRKDRKE